MKLFIAQSVDGFIAGPDGSLAHLERFGGNDYGSDAFVVPVDAVVIGRGTFDAIYPKHGWPYPPRLRGAVVTSRPLPEGVPDHVLGTADLDRIAAEFSGAYLDGGGVLIRQCLERGLVREARIFTLPLALGDGVRLFPRGRARVEPWTLLEAKAFPCGTVLHHYAVGQA